MKSRNWAEVPQDLLTSIAELLPIPDTFRFSGACKSWYTAAANDVVPRHLCRFPWLALTPSINKDDVFPFPKSLDFFNSSENRHYRISIPESFNINFLAHSNGWILFHDDDNLELPILLNPITRVKLELPSFKTLPFKFHRGNKIFLPAATSPPNSMLTFVTYGGFRYDCFLAFASPGDNRWSVITPQTAPPGTRSADPGGLIADVQSHNGRFYVMWKNAQMAAFDLIIPAAAATTLTFLASTPRVVSTAVRLVPVPSTGDLLMLQVKMADPRDPVSYWLDIEFDILKFDSEADEWVEFTDLGDQSLFLDWYGAMVLPSRDIPGLRTNCIYFANPLSHSDLPITDVRVYEVGNTTEKKKCFFAGPQIDPLRSMWFMPSLMKHNTISGTIK